MPQTMREGLEIRNLASNFDSFETSFLSSIFASSLSLLSTYLTGVIYGTPHYLYYSRGKTPHFRNR